MNEADRQRLQHIITYCKDMEGFVDRFGRDYEIFITDRAFFNSVSMCVLQIGELSNALSEDFRNATNDEIPWKMIRGMRNWLAHAYGEVDESILWETVNNEIPFLLDFCKKAIDLE